MARRFIDADAFWKKLISKCEEDWCDLMVVYELLNEMPSADVRENVHGEWIDETFEPYGLVFHPFKCNLCGEHSECDSDFCPNCGADMRGEKNENR